VFDLSEDDDAILNGSAQEREDLYQAIGEATTAWARVEGGLGVIFITMVAGDAMAIDNILRNLAARAAFHAIINFNSKLAVTNAAARWFLVNQPSYLARWTSLQNRTKRQAKRRNDIVHFALVKAEPAPPLPFEYYLTPSLFGTHHLIGTEPSRLRLNDILARSKSFRALANDLFAFATTIGASRTPPPESLARQSDSPPGTPGKA
jgi:hypothetical protein